MSSADLENFLVLFTGPSSSPSAGAGGQRRLAGHLAEESPSGRERRTAAWRSVDANGNGLASVAEVDRWIKSSLVSKYGKDDGVRLWRAYRPATLRAFDAVKDLAPPPTAALSATTDGPSGDDYITKREFRLLVALLGAYSIMVDAFTVLDGGGGETATDDCVDRRVGLDEWLDGRAKMDGYHFAAFSNGEKSPERLFDAMNADGGEKVLFKEWFDYLEKAEADAGDSTEMGKLFTSVHDLQSKAAARILEEKKAPQAPPPPAVIGPTDDFLMFESIFRPISLETVESRHARAKAWNGLDANGNGMASLAEVDRWIRIELVAPRSKSKAGSPSKSSPAKHTPLKAHSPPKHGRGGGGGAKGGGRGGRASPKTLTKVGPTPTSADAKKKEKEDRERDGERIWRTYRPAYLRAFRRARDVSPPEEKTAEASGGGGAVDNDEYVTKKEFRLLCGFLCAYARMHDAFRIIDGSAGAGSNNGNGPLAPAAANPAQRTIGAGAKIADDHRIERREWIQRGGKVSKHGLVALQSFSEKDPAAVFDDMDADRGGMVLFGEWCRYLEEAEMEADTEIGKLFLIAREGRRRHTEAIVRKSVVLSSKDLSGVEDSDTPLGPSQDFNDFDACFASDDLTDRDSPTGRDARSKEWSVIDANGNGLASLAEVDRWVRMRLQSTYGEGRGHDLWKLFRPSFVRAFTRAKGIAPTFDVKGDTVNEEAGTNTDDYISKSEFRPLIAYLRAAARMLDAFALIDGGGPGVDANDDRRIDLKEWLNGYRKVSGHGLVGLVDIDDPQEVFYKMDMDGGGVILLGEWVRYLGRKEVEAGTEMGKLILIGGPVKPEEEVEGEKKQEKEEEQGE